MKGAREIRRKKGGRKERSEGREEERIDLDSIFLEEGR